MGTDIRFAVELRTGERHQHGVAVPVWSFDPQRSHDLNEATGRNYHLFDILGWLYESAGDRGIVPIAPLAGLPEDIDPLTRSDEWYDVPGADRDGPPTSGCMVDRHSYGHLTLQQIMDYDWTREIPKVGMARDVCRSFCEWVHSQRNMDGDELRIVFGFS